MQAAPLGYDEALTLSMEDLNTSSLFKLCDFGEGVLQ
jgi:hypothetical protein